MLKYGICNEIFKGWTWKDTVDFVSGLGYDGIEAAPFTLADSVEKIDSARRSELREYAAGKGLEIIGLHWLLVSPGGLSMSSPDAGIRRRTADYLKSLIAFCADTGGRFLVLGSPKQRSVHPGSTREETFDYVSGCLLSALPEAADRSVDVLIEPLGRSETNFLTTAGEAIEFINRVSHPNLKLHLDVKAMCSENKAVPEIIESSADHLKHVHVNDPNRGGPGSGALDYGPLRDALERIGYAGYLSVEVFDFSPGPEEIACKSLEYLKTIFGKGKEK